MSTRLLPLRSSLRLSALGALTLCAATGLRAQGNGVSLELHVNENVSASSIGLPHFPTSHPYKGESKDSAADVGFTFGSVHFRVMASRYQTNASAEQVMDFYRKPLARFGEVLECEHGQPVGERKATKEGLTCSDSHSPHSHAKTDFDSPRQLRSGTPERYRVVAIDSSELSVTDFTLVYLEVPKDDDSH
ncbi:MAG: hypothetical protein M3Y30_13195 [Gemmatimonadota bacterium]|nr:hypothetical protein [Gemmatimonadota bacterium]